MPRWSRCRRGSMCHPPTSPPIVWLACPWQRPSPARRPRRWWHCRDERRPPRTPPAVAPLWQCRSPHLLGRPISTCIRSRRPSNTRRRRPLGWLPPQAAPPPNLLVGAEYRRRRVRPRAPAISTAGTPGLDSLGPPSTGRRFGRRPRGRIQSCLPCPFWPQRRPAASLRPHSAAGGRRPHGLHASSSQSCSPTSEHRDSACASCRCSSSRSPHSARAILRSPES
mmetsp:Transcript_81417/g.206829  ORF Transcript_81417/g.206829 Transcript_81417/m.206829 type:complete len:224 (+) Transcript_81417:242-913(+)